MIVLAAANLIYLGILIVIVIEKKNPSTVAQFIANWKFKTMLNLWTAHLKIGTYLKDDPLPILK